MRADRLKRRRQRWLLLGLGLAALVLALGGGALQAAPADTFVVNSLVDVNDADPGNSVCETAPGNQVCTLRAAVQEANSNEDHTTILLPAGTYLLNRSGVDNSAINGDLDITGSLTLMGAGAAATIIDAKGIPDRVFEVREGTVFISGVTLSNGTAHSSGGGGGLRAHLGASVELSGTIVTGNTASGTSPSGGGILSSGRLTVRHSLVYSNTVASVSHVPQGGGIFNNNQDLLIEHSHIYNNAAVGGFGGGLYTTGLNGQVATTTFSANRALRGGGVAIHYSPQTDLINVTLSGNRASYSGGGVNMVSSTGRLYNVTVTGNWANDEEGGNYLGGGIANDNGTLIILNSLFAGNSRTQWQDPFPVLLGSDCAGAVTLAGPNFVGATDDCALLGPAPLTGFAQLHPLADNGGPAPTHALRSTSPAIDAGAEAGCTDPLGAPLLRDQRGAPRTLWGRHSLRCDLGAYEYVGPVFVPFVRR